MRVILVLLLLAGCGLFPPERVVVSGDLVSVGGPAPASAAPLRGTVVFASTGITQWVPVGASGRFTVRLPVGRYQVTGRLPGVLDGAPCGPSTTLDARPGAASHIQVVCSIK